MASPSTRLLPFAFVHCDWRVETRTKAAVPKTLGGPLSLSGLPLSSLFTYSLPHSRRGTHLQSKISTVLHGEKQRCVLWDSQATRQVACSKLDRTLTSSTISWQYPAYLPPKGSLAWWCFSNLIWKEEVETSVLCTRCLIHPSFCFGKQPSRLQHWGLGKLLDVVPASCR